MRYLKPINLLTVATILFSVFVLCFNLGGRYLENWDEGWYALVVKVAIEKHEYLELEFRNGIYWDRTPFAYYPMMASYMLFGINEYSSRLPSAIFAVGLLLIIFLVARRYYGQWTAILSVLITTTITQFVFDHGLKTANIDSITIFFMFGSLASWLLIRDLNYKIILTMVFLGFAFMCKGPIISIPIIAIGLSFFVDNPIKKSSLRPFFMGLLLDAVIVLPWHIYMYKAYGDVFVKFYIIRNFIQRFTEGIDGHQYGSFYYIDFLLSPGDFIWIGVAVVAVFYFARLFMKEKRMVDFTLLAWVVVTFTIVNKTKSQLWWYIFPIYPALSVMTAKTLVDFIKKRDIVNSSAYYLGFAVIVAFIFGHRLFLDNIFRIPVMIALLAVLSFYCWERIIIRKYLPKYREGFSIILVIFLCLLPVYRAVKLTMAKNETPPVVEVFRQLSVRAPVYTYEVFPSDIYYLSKIFDVREYYLDKYPERLIDLKGKIVVARTEKLEELKPGKSSSEFQVDLGGNPLFFNVIAQGKMFSIVRVD